MRMTRNWSVEPGNSQGSVLLSLHVGNEMKTMELQCTAKELREGREAWDRGAYVQEAFPMLSADEREFLMTGITPDEWDEAFGDSRK